jgi:hypothetical protein
VAILNDHTVPEKQHIGDDWDDDELTRYPDHTRLVERSIHTMGSQAYAIFLPGARKMLYECGTKRIERAGKANCDRQAFFDYRAMIANYTAVSRYVPRHLLALEGLFGCKALGSVFTYVHQICLITYQWPLVTSCICKKLILSHSTT